MASDVPPWVEKDRDFIAMLLFCALSAYSLVSAIRASDLLIRIEAASSIPINLMAGYSFMTRDVAREKTARGEFFVPLTSFAMPFMILNVAPLFPIAYSFPALVVLGFIGIALSLASLAYLRRSFAILPAVRQVVSAGPYSVVRHPLYLAEMMYISGFMLIGFNLISVALFAVLLAVTVWRIIIEERKLGKYPDYADYASKVRFRLLPGIF